MKETSKINKNSLDQESAINFLWWLQNWGYIDETTVKDEYFEKLVKQYNSCSHHDHKQY